MTDHRLDHQVEVRPVQKGDRTWYRPTCSCGWSGSTQVRPGRANYVAKRDHLDRLSRRCPTPHKQRFNTKRAAEDRMHRFWRTGRTHRNMPIRVYRCPCGGWHTTKRPLITRPTTREDT